MLESQKQEELYIGYTNNLRKRIVEHNRGHNTSTKRYKPWKLVYYEACLEEEDAKRREKHLKTSQRRRFLKRRIKEYFYKKKMSTN